MSSHIHLLCATNGFVLSDVMRDFKRLTSGKIIETIREEPQSRREWMLEYFSKACEHVKKKQKKKYGKMVIMQSIFIVINSYVKN
jgi:hypothetical protein